MKVAVKKFQSLESVSIEVDGFTVITGQSNLGKSAFVRAVAAALFGFPGDHYIRHGAAQCAVGMNDNGVVLKWYKTAAGKSNSQRSTFIEINGTKHSKIGKEHAQLTEPLGFKEIETSLPRLRPQVAFQHDPIFLLAENPTIVAEVLKMLGRADVVTEAQRLAKRDYRDAESKGKVRETDIATAEAAVLGAEKVEADREQFDRLQNLCRAQFLAARVSMRLAAGVGRLRDLAPRMLPGLLGSPRTPVGVELLVKMRKLGEIISLEVPGLPEAVSLPKALKPLVCVGSHRLVVGECAVLAQARDLVLGELERASQRRVELEKELGVCPVCGRGFGQD